MMRLDEAVRKYVGKPFRHQGRDPEHGVDCVGALVLGARDCGMDWVLSHDSTGYARNPGRGQLEARLFAAFGPPIPKEMMRPGDVVAIDFYGMSRHVGVIGSHNGRLTIIHAMSRPPRIVENGIDERWNRYIKAVYRVSA